MLSNCLQTIIKVLPLEFIGRGEVKGFTFKQIEASDYGYIYHVSANSSCEWYEVFRKKINTRFATIAYPNSKSFGITAWTCKTLEKANRKFTSLQS